MYLRHCLRNEMLSVQTYLLIVLGGIRNTIMSIHVVRLKRWYMSVRPRKQAC